MKTSKVYGFRPNGTIEVTLYDYTSTPSIYWSPRLERGGLNSYVVAARPGEEPTLYCVNGAGEIRWTVHESNIASILRSKKEGHLGGDYLEQYGALKYFGMVEEEE